MKHLSLFLSLLFLLSCNSSSVDTTRNTKSKNSTYGDLNNNKLNIRFESDDKISVYRNLAEKPILTQNAKKNFRPFLHPIVSPDGKGLFTEYSPGHHKHQTGIYWGFTRVNGSEADDETLKKWFYAEMSGKTIPKEIKNKLGRDFFHHPTNNFYNDTTDYWIRENIQITKSDGDTVSWETSYNMLDSKGETIMIETQRWSIFINNDMYFLDMDGFQIIGSSPEILVKLEDDKVTVRPIAGTRPRGESEQEDQKNEKDLLSDPKELAEHLMLIDLGRNDIGRISKVGTVKLTEKMIIERYSHVMHIVSNVNGIVADKTRPLDVLRATFPAGTVSGAPKIRAMEIINELEPLKRGIYSGAIGYLSWTGDLDTALSIRTAIIKDGFVHVQAGAGIVYDSVPETEWEETMNKAMALLKASEIANAKEGNK